MKVGIVEDNPSIGSLLQTTLGLLGHSPSLYYNGWSFLEQLFSEDSESFDAVIIDLVLPQEISGTQVITTLRIHHPSLPIIVISAVDALELRDVQRRYPGIMTLQKPFSLYDLRTHLTQAAVKGLLREYTVLRA
jgi:two-component system OmpR family response regulator